tara:strand:+ start:414 stop:1442 length:1029 start_codon:yes stop_codon:yes gene_type:complete
MKLVEGQQDSSFYESFSDLIFATMAIFVLLLIVFLVQVNAQTVKAVNTEQLRVEAAAQTAELEETREQMMQVEEQNSELQDELDKSEQEANALKESLKVRPLELVVVMDVSGSMTTQMDVLRQALRQLTLLLPSLSDDIKIGIVVYQSKIKHFPENQNQLQRILQAEDDNGASFRSVTDWMAKWLTPASRSNDSASVRRLRQYSQVSKLSPSSVNIIAGVKRGISLFTKVPPARMRQVFLLIGDVGPFEGKGRVEVISPEESREAQVIQQTIRDWAVQREQRGVIALRVRTQNREQPLEPNTDAFFKGVASAAGENGKYTEDWENVLVEIVAALLERKEFTP